MSRLSEILSLSFVHIAALKKNQSWSISGTISVDILDAPFFLETSFGNEVISVFTPGYLCIFKVCYEAKKKP